MSLISCYCVTSNISTKTHKKHTQKTPNKQQQQQKPHPKTPTNNNILNGMGQLTRHSSLRY